MKDRVIAWLLDHPLAHCLLDIVVFLVVLTGGLYLLLVSGGMG